MERSERRASMTKQDLELAAHLLLAAESGWIQFYIIGSSPAQASELASTHVLVLD